VRGVETVEEGVYIINNVEKYAFILLSAKKTVILQAKFRHMMKIPFKVSARTARLIGRENIATSKGAIIELVKDGYDADSPVVFVFFDNFYSSFHDHLSKQRYDELISEGRSRDTVDSVYKYNESSNTYIVNEDVSDSDKVAFEEKTSRLASIFIVDSGEGMTLEVISNSWMTIGTDNKATSFLTKNGRIKAGAKGIGRFALDKLGETCEMMTFFNPVYHNDDMSDREKTGEIRGYKWSVNWDDFEVGNKSIDFVNADLIELVDKNLKSCLPINNIPNALKDLYEQYSFTFGTILKIKKLRETWEDYFVQQVFSDMEVLVPPQDTKEFELYVFSSLEPSKYGEVQSSICDDYDYKISAHASSDQMINISVYRQENDIDLIPKDFFERKAMMQSPYTEEDFRKGYWQTTISFANLIPGFKEIDDNDIFSKIGEFDFTFYYLKKTYTSTDARRFFYRSINAAERKQWLDSFGGIKLYRDEFRVRPYGEKKDAAFDWLMLGTRKSQSPAGIAKGGNGYRVEPDNISGVIKISRTTNLNFEDKSSREGLQENQVFQIFKKLIIGIIQIFEKDRSYIAHEMALYDEEKYGDLRERERIEAYAKKKLEESRTDDSIKASLSARDHALVMMAQVNEQKDKEIEKLKDEQTTLRAMASAGLVLSAFSHDLSKQSDVIEYRYEHFKYVLKQRIAESDYAGVEDRKNPFVLIDDMKNEDLNMQNWLNFALGAARKDKRKRKQLVLKNYISRLFVDWHTVLESRGVDYHYFVDDDISMRAFELDLDSIFNNLITNSIDAFIISKENRPREIDIKIAESNQGIQIDYLDNGPGLSPDILNHDDIFKAMFTTKRNKITGEEDGTGLGLWIVKSIVEEYDGNINILYPPVGFGIRIVLPIKYKK
jgi:signal transduction histidine kinase